MKYTNDHNKLLDITVSLRELSHVLYRYSCAGGPLHIAVDDGNLLDIDLHFCRREVESNNQDHGTHILMISSCILDLLERLSPAQRLEWWMSGRLEGPDVAELADLYDKTYLLEDDGTFTYMPLEETEETA